MTGRVRCIQTEVRRVEGIRTACPDLIDDCTAVIPAVEMSLHVPVKIPAGSLDQLTVVGVAIPVFQVSNICLAGTSDNDAPVRPRDQIIEIPIIEPQRIRIRQQRRPPRHGDAAADGAVGDDFAVVLGQQGRRVRVGRHDDLLRRDGASGRGYSPEAVRVAIRRDGPHGCIGLEVDSPGEGVAEHVVYELEGPEMAGRVAEAALGSFDAGELHEVSRNKMHTRGYLPSRQFLAARSTPASSP